MLKTGITDKTGIAGQRSVKSGNMAGRVPHLPGTRVKMMVLAVIAMTALAEISTTALTALAKGGCGESSGGCGGGHASGAHGGGNSIGVSGIAGYGTYYPPDYSYDGYHDP